MKPKKRIKPIFCKLGTSKENVVAYCVYHKSTLSLRQMKAKKCLAKDCKCLKRTESHPYWAEREAIKLKRKEKKNAD